MQTEHKATFAPVSWADVSDAMLWFAECFGTHCRIILEHGAKPSGGNYLRIACVLVGSESDVPTQWRYASQQFPHPNFKTVPQAILHTVYQAYEVHEYQLEQARRASAAKQ